MGAVKQGLRRARALRPEKIRKEATRPFRLSLQGADAADQRALVEVFVPDTLRGAERALAAAHVANDNEPHPEVRVCTPAARRMLGGDGVVVDPRDPGPGLAVLLEEFPDYRLALARVFPPLREALAHELIRAMAVRNAAIAAMSALPDVIPNPLSLLLALGEMGSDTVLLTANQICLCFQLAALRGQPVGWRAQFGPITGIVASGLGWRTLARELVGLIPAGVGVAAKSAIAFSGTMAVGTALWRLPGRTTGRHGKAKIDPFTGRRALASRRQSA